MDVTVGLTIGQYRNDFGDPLRFHLVQPAGQSFHLSCEISHHLLDGLVYNLEPSWFPEDESK